MQAENLLLKSSPRLDMLDYSNELRQLLLKKEMQQQQQQQEDAYSLLVECLLKERDFLFNLLNHLMTASSSTATNSNSLWWCDNVEELDHLKSLIQVNKSVVASFKSEHEDEDEESELDEDEEEEIDIFKSKDAADINNNDNQNCLFKNVRLLSNEYLIFIEKHLRNTK